MLDFGVEWGGGQRQQIQDRKLRADMSDTEKLIELAKGRFEDFSRADEILFAALAAGEQADYREGGDKDKIENAGSWTDRRIIKANRIEWLCSDRQAKGLVTDRGIRVEGAKIRGEVDLSFAEIPFPLGFLRCVFTEKIIIQHSRIKFLNLGGSHTGSIWAGGVKVEGGVYLRNGFKAKGEVNFLIAIIGGDFDCTRGEFINKDGKAISAGRMDIKGDVCLRDGFKAKGEVRFLGAIIGGNFSCIKGEFINGDDRAISADGIKIGGHAYLREGFRAEGLISFVSAKVGGSFVWTGVNLDKKTKLDLRDAKIGVLWDDVKNWPKKGNLFLDGFVYDSIGDYASKDAKSRIEWLNRQGEERFRPGPYEQLAKVLNKMGHSEDAKKILIEKEKKITRLSGFGWWRRFWRGVLGVTIGYGYRPWRALWFIAAIIFIGTMVFWSGYKAGVIVPVEKEAYVSKQGGQLREGYPKFSALVYSIDMFVPLVDLRMEKYWCVCGGFTRGYMWFHIGFGWILTTLLVVGLTGLVRK